MSKKIIASLIAITILVLSVFAGCNKSKKDKVEPYNEKDKYVHVTDENGNKAYDENGEFIVYVTDEHNKRVTDKNGNELTTNQRFESFVKDNVIEDYGYTLPIPDGFKTTDKVGELVNKKTGATISISPMNDLFENKLNEARLVKKEMTENKEVAKMYTVSLNENFAGPKNSERAYSVSIKTDGFIQISYVFEINRNLFKVVYAVGGENKATEEEISSAFAVSGAILDSMEFKPYVYFEERESENTITTNSITEKAETK